ncbi:hypothetical protein [Agromyces sp. Soil535]|uniref:hypothetical protein n=1 Tax=Agromyces sp. Soil535 TaxID=1736390 RepID=UPI000AAB7BC0|nr:hypothetical protein [Agromyces sp. Soil535]
MQVTDELSDESVIRDLHRQFADLGELEHHVVDTTAMDLGATVDLVRELVERGTARLA